MQWSSFCGPASTERSIIAGSEDTANWAPSFIQSPNGKAQYTLYRTPGIGAFTDTAIATGSSRGAFTQNGRSFFVVDTGLIEVLADGANLPRGTIADDGKRVNIAANRTQLFLVSSGSAYVYTLATDTLTDVSGTIGDAVTGATFQDGYFLTSVLNSNEVAQSAPNNGLVWDALDRFTAESSPDNNRALASINEALWVFKEKSSQVFNNTTQGFVPNQGAVIAYGIEAPASLAQVDNALIAVVSNENGKGIIARFSAGQARRVSNYPLEFAMASYGTISDAEGSSIVLSGHSYYRVTFPSAFNGLGASWQLDVDSGQWVRIPYFNSATGREEAHRARVYTSAFGKLLCGDRANGKIYELSMRCLDDDGAVIRRVRRAPHLVKERKLIHYRRLRFDANVGIGLNVADTDPPTLGYDPVMMLRWSDDGGKTFCDYRQVRFGKFGEFNCLPEEYALGAGRDRIYDTVVTDPVDWCIAGCYFEAG